VASVANAAVIRSTPAPGHFLQIAQGVTSYLIDPYQLVQFELHCLRIAALRVLDQEDHQEGDYRRPGIDDRLPGIGHPKIGPETAHRITRAIASTKVVNGRPAARPSAQNRAKSGVGREAA
jgi:hypothetical protein